MQLHSPKVVDSISSKKLKYTNEKFRLLSVQAVHPLNKIIVYNTDCINCKRQIVTSVVLVLYLALVTIIIFKAVFIIIRHHFLVWHLVRVLFL